MILAPLFSGLVLGAAGSMHCVGMCGPLALLLPGGTFSVTAMYHLGRTSTYVILGVLVGALLEFIDVRQYEQWFSLFLGGLFLLLWIFDFWGRKSVGSSPIQAWLNKQFSLSIKRNSLWGWWIAGMVNGLLPCGLVYGALLASMGFGSLSGSVLFMFGFGVATAPMLLLISLGKRVIAQKMGLLSQKVLPFWLLIMALVFLLRGANLGIPFLSPKMKTTTQKHACCH
jgi:sulfite exporter TauE/SafE